LHYSL